MKKTVLAIITIITLILVTMPESKAQEAPYKFDFGGGIGMSGYLGDANESNLFKHIGVSGSASVRYIVNTRWALRGLFTVATLSGNTADFPNVLPELKNYKFSSTLFDLGARVEFNFFGYGIGETYKRLRRWSPYLALGIGASLATTGGKAYFAPSIPMAVGVKYKIAERLNLGAEFSMVKTLSDHIDGEISDLYTIKSSFLKNTDWFSTLMVSITYEFGKRCETCNRID